ncbi:hypothetical protein [Streptomyces sp. SGAir0957]
MSNWHQPKEAWPRHSKSWWRETLEFARSSGWHLKPYDGHAWGRIVCDPALEEPCAFLVLSTGNGGEDAARDARKKIERCPHLAAEADGQIVARAVVLLTQADRLMDAADACLTSADRQMEAAELLECADTAAAEAEELLGRAIHAQEQSDALLITAYEVLPSGSDLGCPPSVGEVEMLVIEAGHRSDEAGHMVDGLPRQEPAAALQDRIEQGKERRRLLLRRIRQRGNASGSTCV